MAINKAPTTKRKIGSNDGISAAKAEDLEIKRLFKVIDRNLADVERRTQRLLNR